MNDLLFITVTEAYNDGRSRKVLINVNHITNIREELDPTRHHKSYIFVTGQRNAIFIKERIEELDV